MLTEPLCRIPQIIGFPLALSPPMGLLNVAGKFGRFLQAVAVDSRSITSQVSVPWLAPPHISSLEKPTKNS
jgi:hypothetical protein